MPASLWRQAKLYRNQDDFDACWVIASVRLSRWSGRMKSSVGEEMPYAPEVRRSFSPVAAGAEVESCELLEDGTVYRLNKMNTTFWFDEFGAVNGGKACALEKCSVRHSSAVGSAQRER